MTIMSCFDPDTWKLNFGWDVLFFPREWVIVYSGAMSISHIVEGEWWRFFTPMFIHIGLIHFVFNTLGVYYIGYQLEKVVGKTGFVLIYLVSGVFGTIVSANFNLKYSAGASGAIFGLLGLGLYLEVILRKHLKMLTGDAVRVRGVFGSMIVINFLLGFFVPVIDNAAHFGGWVGGILMSYGFYKYFGTKFNPPVKKTALLVFLLLFILSFAGIYRASQKEIALKRFGNTSQELVQGMIENGLDMDQARFVYYYTEKMKNIDPMDNEVWFLRGQLFSLDLDFERAIQEFRVVVRDPKYREKIESFISKLDGKNLESWKLKQFIGLYPSGVE